MRVASLWWCAVLLVGCGDDRAPMDGGRDARVVDAGDAGARDGGRDAGADAPASDGGPGDAGPGCRLDRIAGWVEGRSLPEGRESHASVLAGGHLHVLGGWSGRAATATALHAAVAADGSLGDWLTGEDLPGPVERPAPVVDGDRLILIGGDDGVSAALATVTVGDVQADGSISGWRASTPLPEPRVGHAAVRVEGHVVVVGGATSITGSPVRQVLSGVLGASGVESWMPAGDLPMAVAQTAAVADGRRVYVLGPGTSIVSAEVAGDGTLGSWRSETPLPEALFVATAVAAGELVIAGGYDGRDGHDAVWSAPIDTDGSLMGFAARPVLPAVRFGHRLVASGSHLYASGGYASLSGGPQPTVYVASYCD